MAKFTAIISYSFDVEYEIEADTYDQADYKALEEATEWLPYSSVKGYTDTWSQIEVDTQLVDGEELED